MLEVIVPEKLATEPRTAAQLETLTRRCLAGYQGEQDMEIFIEPLPDKNPNWECVVKYRGRQHGWGPTPQFISEVEGLKHRFHLKE